ncbi:MAG TPA: asparagine synthase-related protein, partial [Gemmataceae bacterium]|nr:asparagine synthase-related protein [Gemmataceae bacterium]
MSGIVAMIWAENGPAEATTLEKITARMAYRGPDRLRTWSDAHAGLGHALLKLGNQTESAEQPLTLDGQTWISADARIDERDLLSTGLRRHGSQVTRDSPDAFLIAEAHRVFGTDCLQHLKGDFAFAIWDQPAQRLIAAVDRFAIRPLYYAWAGKMFMVSSCLESLRFHPGFRADLDEAAVGDFLLFGHYRDPAATIFAGARRLPPAHVLILEAGGLTISRYWSPADSTLKLPGNGRALMEEFKGVLDAAVADRLQSGHTAILLSGGLDSAVIAASACKRSQRGPSAELHAHTAVYKQLIPDDEQEFATQSAQALGLPISFFAADDFEIFDWIDRLGWMPPEPLDLPGLGATVDFHRRIAADSPVILTGHDGDSLFKASVPAHCRGLLRAGHFSTLVRDVAWYTYRQRRLPHLGWHRRWRKRPERTEPPMLPAWLRPDWVRRSGLEERWQKAHEQSIETGPRDRALAALSS